MAVNFYLGESFIGEWQMTEIDNLKELQEALNDKNVVRMSERQQRGAVIDGIDYDEKHVRQSIIHTREDVVLLVSLMANLLVQSKKTNKRLLGIIVVLIVCFILFLLFK